LQCTGMRLLRFGGCTVIACRRRCGINRARLDGGRRLLGVREQGNRFDSPHHRALHLHHSTCQ
jgi:hypothetical protein